MTGPEAVLDAWFDAAADRETTVQPLGQGHINDTYLVRTATRKEAATRWVLQRINRQVFADPLLVMENLQRLVGFFGVRSPGLVPELQACIDGEHVHRDSAGDYWRLWSFVEGSRTLSSHITSAEAHAAGAAFGRFQRLLEELPGPPLQPAIPGFLDLRGYLSKLDETGAADSDQAANVVDWAFIDARRSLAERFPPGHDLIHADCKLDNVLFAVDGPEVLSVLDLDTVMPGHWAWDFGDLVRSVGTTAGAVSDALFAATARGFVEARRFAPSVDDLIDAPRYVAFMLGVRFLTDHLQGDTYFKVARRGENLERAQQQFVIVEALERQAPQFAKVLEAG